MYINKKTFKLKYNEESVFCSILLEQIREGYKTKCNHYFSHEGILGWLKMIKNVDEIKCPACRANLIE